MATQDTVMTPPKVEAEKPKVQPPKKAALFMHNEDSVSFQQVWKVLRLVFSWNNHTIMEKASAAHESGKVLLLGGTKELIETRLAQCQAAARRENCQQLPFSVEDE